MRKLILTSLATLLSITLIFLFLRSNPGATQSEYVPQEDYVPDEVLVKFEKEVSKYDIQDAINSVQGKIITYQNKEISPFQWDPSLSSHKSFYLDNDLFHLKVPEAVGTEQAIFVLRQIPYVKYAEMNGIIRASRTPNDPDFNLLWGLHNTGQSEGTADADIDAPEAWDIFTGSSDIVVAVIDSGVDYNHEDLAANVWINWDEYYGTPNVDDNDPPNGYVDDIYGYDFVNDDDHDPMDDWDPIYHGTHVAGTLGAVGNNGKGVTGVNWNVKIMCLKILNSAGSGSWGDAIHAIKYATANGAHLSNNSWDNGTYYSEAMYDAIEEAKDAGKLFIAAAGNYPKRPWYNNDEIPNYPANYDLDNIIAVLSTDHNDNRSSFSHFGAISVDIGAPGGSGTGSVEDIYSTKRGNAYQYMAGTSMAAPHVAGAAALVWGHRPNLSWDEVKSVLMYGAE
jgi:subtilisin family serine protease